MQGHFTYNRTTDHNERLGRTARVSAFGLDLASVQGLAEARENSALP
jgi:hypothetical protein